MGVLEKVRKAPAVAVELPLDQIIMGDCIANMRALPDACVDMVFADPPWELWQTKGAEISAAAVSYADEGAHVRVILEAPGGYEVPVPEGWKLRKVIGKGKGQPAASVLVRQTAE